MAIEYASALRGVGRDINAHVEFRFQSIYGLSATGGFSDMFVSLKEGRATKQEREKIADFVRRVQLFLAADE
jgi:hypothetical protein